MYQVNRKKVNRNVKKVPVIKCKPIKEAWSVTKSMERNITDMGLVLETNKAFPIPKSKDLMKPKPLEPEVVTIKSQKDKPVKKTEVLKKLEDEANAPRKGTMRIPNEQLKKIQYFIDKYGEDYKAMARDPKNYYQETPAQFKQKIKQFLKRPAYVVPYLRERGVLPPRPAKNTSETSVASE
nr:EOG090X0IKC [Eulimnadia texana]